MTGADDEPRVDVRPAAEGELRALIEGPERFEATFGRAVEAGYSSFEGVLEHSLDAITGGGVPAEWSTYLFYDPDELGGAVIGIGGFKGVPEDGTVEIGYEIAPSRRGQGRATAAAAALIARARTEGCTRILAHTLAEESASTSVLGRLGFTRTATIDDPEDGPVWRWELSV